MEYILVKTLHIISATILFGTGVGSAFYLFFGYFRKNAIAFAEIVSLVVLADWIFTTPAIVIQFITGIYLTSLLHFSFSSLWFVLVAGFFCLIGMLWLPVVFIQIKMKKILLQNPSFTPEVKKLFRSWVILGCIAFSSMLLLFWLMVSKWGLDKIIF